MGTGKEMFYPNFIPFLKLCRIIVGFDFFGSVYFSSGTTDTNLRCGGKDWAPVCCVCPWPGPDFQGAFPPGGACQPVETMTRASTTATTTPCPCVQGGAGHSPVPRVSGSGSDVGSCHRWESSLWGSDFPSPPPHQPQPSTPSPRVSYGNFLAPIRTS